MRNRFKRGKEARVGTEDDREREGTRQGLHHDQEETDVPSQRREEPFTQSMLYCKACERNREEREPGCLSVKERVKESRRRRKECSLEPNQTRLVLSLSLGTKRTETWLLSPC